MHAHIPIRHWKCKTDKQTPRRLSWTKQEEINNLVRDKQKQRVIEPSKGPCTSPIVLVQKSIRVDQRKLSDVTQNVRYLLPRIDNTLDNLVGSRWFSTLDLMSGKLNCTLKTKRKLHSLVDTDCDTSISCFSSCVITSQRLFKGLWKMFSMD